MKRPLLFLPLGLLVGVLAFGVVHWWMTHEPRAISSEPGGELTWLRREFQMSEDQFARVSALHQAYRPTCAELCRRIAEQNRRLERAALDSTAMSPDLERLVTETGRVRDDCRRAMLAHLYAVAAAMPPQQGKRYLSLMLENTCVLQQARTIDDVHAGHGIHDAQ